MNTQIIKKAVCVMSGGLDSTLSAYMMKDEGYQIIAVHFNYGQRTQNKELECFNILCESLDIEKKYILDLDFFKELGASALTDKNIDIPVTGIEEGVPSTYVPFRNGIFLSMSAAIAEKEGASAISIGVVEEDSSGYPDCRPEYIESFERMANLATKFTQEDKKIMIHTPLIDLKKSEIILKGNQLGIDYGITHSCYDPSNTGACGLCDACVLRKKGFEDANITDPTIYQ
jgi:7-cyano-7-deazaguanine synthase